MNDFGYHSNVEVQAISPIHIGSGNKLTPINFIFHDQKITVIDDVLLLRWLSENDRLSNQFVSQVENNVPIIEILDSFHKSYSDLEAYSIPMTVFQQPSEVQEFIKDTATLYPYLPGSSLKGSLRSALLRGILLSDNEKRIWADKKVINTIEQIYSNRRIPSASGDIEAEMFVPSAIRPSKRPNYDLNRTLSLTDSKPISFNHLEVIETRILSIQSNGQLKFKLQNNKKPLSIHVEAIKPKSIFKLLMHRDLKILSGMGASRNLELYQQKFSSLMTHLSEYCRIASDQLLEEEIIFYKNHGNSELEEWFVNKRDLQNKADKNIFILPIGWGSGFDAKAITDLLEPGTFEQVTKTYRNTNGLGYPGRNSSLAWLGPFDAPKSRKVAVRFDKETNNTLLEPLGWVAVKINDENSPDVQEEWDHLTNQSDSPMRNYESQQPIQISMASDIEEISFPKSTVHLILSFDSLPKINDQFYGQIFAIEDDGIYLEIPGLSPDEIAFGWIASSSITQDIRSNKSILCQVIDVLPDSLQPLVKKVICTISKR